MKKKSLAYACKSVFLGILLASCDSSADNQAPVAALVDTITAQSNPDTNMLPDAALAIKEPAIVPPTVAPAATNPGIKKTPIATNTNATKQKSGVETPPASQPVAKTPDVVLPVNPATPEVETKPATPKSPKVKQVAFSLKAVKAVIKGSSSLHAWESNVSQMEGKGSFELKDEALVAVKDVEIKIAVKGIKSKEGKKMDNKTYETFQSDKYPNIVYTLSNAVVKINDSNIVTIEALGKLTMAGTTQSAPLSATGKKLPNGDLQLSVSKKLKMTDYKMEPPVMLLGTIKVGDEITVDFDFVLERGK